LDHESGTLYLLLFVTQTRPCASGNSWKCFSLSDGHGAGGVELAPLHALTHLLTYLLRQWPAIMAAESNCYPKHNTLCWHFRLLQ